MTGNPWTKFFWSDWENDKKLRLCSLAAQGLWMRMLCVCAESDQVGFLMVNGKTVTIEALAKLVGNPVEEIAALVGDLEINGVFYRDRHGNIYNKRMTDAEKVRKDNQKNGSTGGKVSVRKQKGIFDPLGKETERQSERTPERPPERDTERPPEPHGRKPEANSHKPEAKASLEGDALKDFGDSVLAAFGMSPQEFIGHFTPIRDLERQGHSPETILAVAKRISRRDGLVVRGNPMGLLTKAFPDELAKMLTEQRVNAPAEFIDHLAEKWRQRIDRFKNASGFWADSWGPKPGQPGCECPAGILAEFGYGVTP